MNKINFLYGTARLRNHYIWMFVFAYALVRVYIYCPR